MNAIFKGLQVLDLSSVLAGPSVATFFAELGAKVIKVENPHFGGDVTRSWKLDSERPEASVSAYFSSVNYGKSYLTLDLGDPHNRLQLEDLIASSDIIIVNFKHGDDIKFRLSPQDVLRINPQAIYASLKGFASDERRVAYDVVLQAETGFMYMNGTPNSGPLKMPVAIIDVIAAHQLKEGILCALIQRIQSGKGAVVRCSLEQAALTALVNQASNFLMAGRVAQPMGSLHPNIAPYGETFVCADKRYVVLAIGSDAQFSELCDILNLPDLAKDSRYCTNQLRVANRNFLYEELSKAFLKKKRDAWMDAFHAHRIPAGAINTMAEVMQGSAALDMIRKETIDGIETTRLSSVAFTLEF